MIRLYTAANLQDAHLLLGLLDAAGIRGRIFNANALGALGEIPFTSAYPEIWIERVQELERAREVIAAFERPGPPGEPLRCAHCGEENPAAFEICWNCGGATGTADRSA